MGRMRTGHRPVVRTGPGIRCRHRWIQDGEQAVGGVGIAGADGAHQRPRGLGEPELQVGAGTAHLLGYELGRLGQQMLASPPPQLAGQIPPDRPGQQLGLPGVIGQHVEEARIGPPGAARPRAPPNPAPAARPRPPRPRPELVVQLADDPGVQLRQAALQHAALPLAPCLHRLGGQHDEPSPPRTCSSRPYRSTGSARPGSALTTVLLPRSASPATSTRMRSCDSRSVRSATFSRSERVPRAARSPSASGRAARRSIVRVHSLPTRQAGTVGGAYRG